VAAAFERAARTPITAAGVDLRCDNKIPLARGLGSSTAAAACGLIAGWTFIQHEWTEDELCTALMDLDGHPDNAAACAYGGIVLCLDRVDTDELDCITLGAADWLFPIAVIPDRELATADARRVVPTTFERRDVVRAMGASSLLVGGLMGGHIELVADALNLDVIHEPYRRELVPELADARLAAEAADALGATLSGAGPTVLVWCDQESLTRTLGTLAIDMPDHTLLELRIAAEGARVN
jgi:homoserine kinase